MTDTHVTSTPWYRVPLFWFSVAMVLAVIGGRVAEEYQRDVRERQLDLARDRAAAALGLKAQLQFHSDRRELRIRFNRSVSQLPTRLEVRLRREPEAGQTMMLTRAPDGSYRTLLPELAQGRWQVQLTAEDWRLFGSWDVPRERDVLIEPR